MSDKRFMGLVKHPSGLIVTGQVFTDDQVNYLMGAQDGMEYVQRYINEELPHIIEMRTLIERCDDMVMYNTGKALHKWLDDHYEQFAGKMARYFARWNSCPVAERPGEIMDMLQRRRVAWENALRGNVDDLKVLVAEEQGELMMARTMDMPRAGRPPGVSPATAWLYKRSREIKNAGTPWVVVADRIKAELAGRTDDLSIEAARLLNVRQPGDYLRKLRGA